MKIDVGEVLATRDELLRTKTHLLGSLSDAKYANYKLPFITVLEEALIGLVNTFDQKIDDFKEIVEETAADAVIDTQTIDELKQTLRTKQNELKELDASFKKTYSSVSDIVKIGRAHV